MNNHREHKVRMGDRGKLFPACSLWFIFIFIVINKSLVAGADTTKIIKYELNDPRNPDCPCHKLQKQAEDEYAKLNHVKNYFDREESVVDNANEKNKNNFVATTEIHDKKEIRTSTSGKNNYRRKRKSSELIKLNLRFFNKPKGVKRVRPNYSVCSKW